MSVRCKVFLVLRMEVDQTGMASSYGPETLDLGVVDEAQAEETSKSIDPEKNPLGEYFLGKATVSSSQCGMCLPEVKQRAVFNNSTSNLQKHVLGSISAVSFVV